MQCEQQGRAWLGKIKIKFAFSVKTLFFSLGVKKKKKISTSIYLKINSPCADFTPIFTNLEFSLGSLSTCEKNSCLDKSRIYLLIPDTDHKKHTFFILFFILSFFFSLPGIQAS